MTPRLLGYAVLLYAIFTSSAGLRLVWLAIGHWDGDWWAISDAGLWLLFVVGGVGLTGDRAWARIVLLTAAVASALTGVLAIVFLWNAGMLLVGLSSILTILVSVAIIIGVRRLPVRDAPKVQTSFGQVEKRDVSRRIDLAYGCFAWIAVAMWFEELGKILPIDPDFGQFLFMLLWVPILFATLFATVAAFVISISEWREWPLLIMTGTLASMIFLFLAVDERGMGSSEVDASWYVGGTAILFAFCIRRLFTVRGRDA